MWGARVWDQSPGYNSDGDYYELEDGTEISSNFSSKAYVNFIQKKKDIIVSNIKKETVDDLLEPIQEAIDECIKDKSSREIKIQKLSEDCKKYETNKKELNEQIKIILAM
jgi:hypothetical protein